MCDSVGGSERGDVCGLRSVPGFVSTADEGDETARPCGRVPVVMNPASYRQARGDGPPGWACPAVVVGVAAARLRCLFMIGSLRPGGLRPVER